MSILTRLNAPCFTAGGRPDLDEDGYRLETGGLVAAPRSFSLAELKALPQSRVDARLTSVSGWSVRAVWEGILWQDLLPLLRPLAEARFATFGSAGGGYETTVGLADLDSHRVVVVLGVEGEPLEADYGGPVRMVIPHLWGYKSAKWLTRISLGRGMKGGYWEDRGYSRAGRIEPGQTLDLNTGRRRPIAGGEVTEF
jgi:DMSO/TMAO reductase YedYZ molybdopterin-dependent catalytic subunit